MIKAPLILARAKVKKVTDLCSSRRSPISGAPGGSKGESQVEPVRVGVRVSDGVRVGVRVRVRVKVRVGVVTWGQCNVCERVHKNRNVKVCVCVHEFCVCVRAELHFMSQLIWRP